MDEMDRLLRSLPEEEAPAGLAAMIVLTVQRRDRRRRTVRWLASALLALLGFWLVTPAPAWWLSLGEASSSGLPWLIGGLEYLNLQSIQMADRLWNSTVLLQDSLGSSMAISIVPGALLLCGALFLALDGRVFQPLPGKTEAGRGSTMLPSGHHI